MKTNPDARHSHRRTFAQILLQTRCDAARSAWRRAQMASRVRHIALSAGNRSAARTASRIKQQAILHTKRLMPDGVEVMPDDRFGQETFRFVVRGYGSLHLPLRLISSELDRLRRTC